MYYAEEESKGEEEVHNEKEVMEDLQDLLGNRDLDA